MQPGFALRDRLIGEVIEGTGGARYTLLEVLGEGGQGWVFKASSPSAPGGLLVIKVLHPGGTRADALKRFEQEAIVLRRLGAVPAPNPHIVRFYDYGTHPAPTAGGHLLRYLALEYVEGQTLARLLEAQGGFGLPVGRVRRMMKQVVSALSTLHGERIVHRDLKPSNILLAMQDGQELARVTDFGLVKLPELHVVVTDTLAGATCGYAPPEQYENRNKRVGVQTDVFSFAAVLHEALAGAAAFPHRPAENPFVMIARMLSDERPALARGAATLPRELRDRPDVTAALDRELGRALSGDPAVRHASIAELWSLVDPLLAEAQGEPVAARGSPPAAWAIADEVSFGGPAASPGAPPAEASGPGRRESAPPAVDAERAARGLAREARGSANPEPPAAAPAPAPWAPAGAFVRAASVQPAAIAAPMPVWQAAGRPMAGELLRSAVLGPDGTTLVALGAHGLYLLARGGWTAVSLPTHVEPRSVRGLLRLPDGELLLHGDGGFAMSLTPGGLATWIPTADRDATLLAAYADARGLAFAGERLSRPVGVVVEVTGHGARAHEVEGVPRLCGVTRLGAGSLAACGLGGALVELGGPRRSPRPIPWARSGHLFALAAAPDGGAFAVGTGGHALRISCPPALPGLDVAPTATLEVVQTTRDLTSASVDASGCAWAAGGQARLLQRRAGVWTRIPLDPSAQGAVVAVFVRAPGLTVVCSDGLVLEAALPAAAP